MPDYWIYCADVYCEKCADAIKTRDRTFEPKDAGDQASYDSEIWPKGPYSDEESDTPEHCGSGENCLDPTIIDGDKYGQFFENPLTTDGEKYVKEATDGPVKDFWMEFYGLKPKDNSPTLAELIEDCRDGFRDGDDEGEGGVLKFAIPVYGDVITVIAEKTHTDANGKMTGFRVTFNV